MLTQLGKCVDIFVVHSKVQFDTLFVKYIYCAIGTCLGQYIGTYFPNPCTNVM